MAVLLDEEYEFNTLIFGGDTDYAITEVDGLDDIELREDIINKSLDHGGFVYAQFLPPRRVTFEGFMGSDDLVDLATKKDLLKRAMGPVLVPLPLGIKWSGEVQKRLNCVPVKRNIPRDLNAALGFNRFTLQFLAEDPRIYAETLSSLVANGNATNAGTIPTHPLVTFEDAVLNPRVTNTTTGLFVQVNENLVLGDSLVIDFAARTIKKNGVSVYNSLDAASRWWQLEPGVNAITFTAGTKEMTWRSAWS